MECVHGYMQEERSDSWSSFKLRGLNWLRLVASSMRAELSRIFHIRLNSVTDQNIHVYVAVLRDILVSSHGIFSVFNQDETFRLLDSIVFE